MPRILDPNDVVVSLVAAVTIAATVGVALIGYTTAAFLVAVAGSFLTWQVCDQWQIRTGTFNRFQLAVFVLGSVASLVSLGMVSI